MAAADRAMAIRNSAAKTSRAYSRSGRGRAAGALAPKRVSDPA
jgi:hypothetical protein